MSNDWRDYAYPLIKKWEGFKSRPYLCPTGHWSIGYGTTTYPNGRAVTPADPAITEAQAQVYLEAFCVKLHDGLVPLIRHPLAPYQLGAIIVLGYNIGLGHHDGIKGDLADSTLLDKVNRGDMMGAANEFLRWNKGKVNGQFVVIEGLTNRRQDERHLFLGGMYGA
jgi:lysozyme